MIHVTFVTIINLPNRCVFVVQWLQAQDFGIEINEFELQSRHYDHFRINTLGKGMNPLIFLAMG